MLTNLQSYRADIVEAASDYVAIDRANRHTATYTNGRADIGDALNLRGGTQVAAFDDARKQHAQGVGNDPCEL